MSQILSQIGVIKQEEKLKQTENQKMKMIHIYLNQKKTVFKQKMMTMKWIQNLLNKNKEKLKKKMQYQQKLMVNTTNSKISNQELFKKPKIKKI